LQKEPVGDKILARHIKVGLYLQNDELISDIHEIHFDIKSNDLEKMHKQVIFNFNTDMTALNGQNIYLKVMSKVSGTDIFKKELNDKKEIYTVNISFGAEEW